MKFDDILKIVGEFGRYQRRLYVLTIILKSTLSWAVLISVFINAPVDHWCKTFEWDASCEQYGLTTDECKLAQKQGGIPYNYTSDGELKYAQCEKYNVSGVGFWPGIDPSDYNSETTSCENGWAYDHSHYESTTVTDFDLVCGKEDLTQVSQSIFYGGCLAGALFFGILSDMIGRWWGLFLANLVTFISGVVIVFSPNWWFFAILRFFMGVGNTAFNVTVYVIGLEFIGPSKRHIVMLSIVGYALGYMLLALLAYFIRSWRTLQLVMSAPSLLIFIAFIWLPESARWLMSIGKYEKAEKIIYKVAEVNKADLPRPLFTEEFIAEQEQIRTERRPNGIDLVRTPRIRMRTIALVYMWIVNSMVYNGLSLNTSNLGVNEYIAFAIAGGIEIPAIVMDVIIVQYFGRKPSLLFCLTLGGISCLSTAFISPGVALTSVATIGKFGITAAFNILYLYTAELYPTIIRGVAIGNCLMFARIGGILAPLLLTLSKYWHPLPLVIYGCATILSLLVVIALPETRGRKLPETLEEGERFGLQDNEEKDYKEGTSPNDLYEDRNYNKLEKCSEDHKKTYRYSHITSEA